MAMPVVTHGRLVTVATCNLDQWSMDFEGNLNRIKQSIKEAKAAGATYRVGPELEIPGYGCEDHFVEVDTIHHSWEALAELIASGLTTGIVCDVGMPVIHHGVRYNCRVFVLDARVLLIRPKMFLADDGNYREGRYFTTWKRPGEYEEHRLPEEVAALVGARSCPFGDAALQFRDTCLAAESCEELFTPMAPNIRAALSGVEIISNGSGSHHQLRKLDTRLALIRGATSKAGGVYVYANQRGCDGGRLYYDGCASVTVNGALVAQASQFGLQDEDFSAAPSAPPFGFQFDVDTPSHRRYDNWKEVEVVTAVVDLDAVVSFRASVSSLQDQASSVKRIPAVAVDFALCAAEPRALQVSLARAPRRYLPEEEIAFGPAAWLWDYLRRSGSSGFLLPLSGGADSSSTAAIVGSMCAMVVRAIEEGDEQVHADARRIGQYRPDERVEDPHQLASRIFVTAYMGTVNSSGETRARSRQLAQEIGSYHLSFDIDPVVAALVTLFATITGKLPRFRSSGGTTSENLALQNIQARLRMVVAFLLAQLLPWVRGRHGFLLVLGSANVDELLRGYLTKYDCSSADINPIGGISKADLRSFLKWAAVHLGFKCLADVEAAPPTAELEPIVDGQKPQNDEDDMGISYEELGIFGRLRKISRCGPVSMFSSMLHTWRARYSATQIAEKVKFFFRYYAINRHKATTMTPSYHAESYSPDDNRFDHRQFLYNTWWPWQFSRIDLIASQVEQSATRNTGAASTSTS